jgi:4-aminobutyrate aminotransferase-like enzyme
MLVSAIPGPRSRALAQRLQRRESQGVTFISEGFPTFWASASGATVTDVDGNRYLDLSAAFGVATTGHANAAVAQAIANQAGRLPHGMGDVHPSDVKAELLERLAALAPLPEGKAYLCTSGSESVEFALKTALLYTGRPNALAFLGAYHGLAHGALEVTGIERFREPFRAQLRNETAFVEFPDRRDPSSLERVLARIEERLATDASIGAVILEAIQGRAGVIVPPDGFLLGLRAVCDARGVLLIVDEIFTGFGRTGTLFAVMRERVEPDLVCVGKALGGGFPFAATIGRGDVMDAWPISSGEALHTSTYLGNPMGCAAALANLSEIDRLGIVARARALEARIAEKLAPLREQPAVRDLRGRGALWGIECADGELANEWMLAALGRGVVTLQSGTSGEVLTIAPPIVISDVQLDRALELLIASVPS